MHASGLNRVDQLQQQVADLRRDNTRLQLELDASMSQPNTTLDSYEPYLPIIRQSSDGGVLIDKNGMVCEWNPAQEAITGLHRVEVIGRPIWDVQFDLLPWDERNTESRTRLRSTIKGLLLSSEVNQPTTVQWLLQRQDATLRTVETWSMPLCVGEQSLLWQGTREVTTASPDNEPKDRTLLSLSAQHLIDRFIVSDKTPEQIAGAVLPTVRKIAGDCERASVIHYDKERGEVVWLALSEGDETIIQPGLAKPPRFFGDLAKLWAERDYLLLDDINVVAEPSPIEEYLANIGIRSYLVVPIELNDELIGTLNTASRQPGAFDPGIVGHLRIIADALAVAIHDFQLIEQVENSNRRLQALTRRLVESQEEERYRISRELHDEIGQTLTAIKLNLQSLEMTMTPEKYAGQTLSECIEIADHALQQVRNLSLDLRPPLLDDLGLAPTLQWYLDRQARIGQIEIFLHENLRERSLPPEVEITCFRLVQEAVTNVLRHARAQSVTVELQQQDRAISLTVQDDGVGFDTKAAMRGDRAQENLGLMGMEERVILLNGELDIESALDSGTKVSIRLPLTSSSSSLSDL